MSYANLVKKFDARGKVRLRGGQCEGRVEGTGDSISSNKYVPSKGKGAEYAVKFRDEEEKAYAEMLATSSTQGMARTDVTGGEASQMEQPEELTSIGTLPNVRELNREELTQVFTRYNFDPVEPSEHLESIFNQREQIVNLISTNQVCVIKGPTGCGKSTQIPQFILDSHVAQQKHCNIVVTQPRRIAAISIAQRVCRERNWGEPGGIVGYQVGLDRKVEEDTRLLYCTTGVLLEKLISAKHMNDYTHIILDEVHEREEDMDFLMLVVKKFLRTNSPHVKVILMSATIDTSRFQKYFGVTLRNRFEVAVSHNIETKSKYSVQVYYLEGLEKLGPLPIINEDEPMISKDAYNLVPNMIRAFNTIDAEDYNCKRSSEKKGAVLIFLPGLHQIETLHELLLKEEQHQKQNKENPNALNLWLCPLHSSITKDEQEKVTAFAPHGMRKVILSTNIAESSLTIPDVKYVIDFCLTKHLVADPVTGFSSLRMAWASHTNCIQREGRVGRVQDGRVYRMVYKSFYQFKMAKESVPEILRCPLDIVVLKCKRLIEEECPLKIISNALDPPDLDNYEKTILKLKEIGALLMTCRGEIDPLDGDLTFMGRVMGCLPLDIRITKLILLGHLFDVLEETIIMGCAMTVRNIFSEPFQQRLEAYNNKLLWADESESDSIAYLNVYKVWRHLAGLGKFQRSKGSEKMWARLYMLQMRHLKEVALQEEDIKKRLKHFNIQIARHKNKPLWNEKERPLILKLALAGAFYPNYYSCNNQNPNAEIEAAKILSGHSPDQCVYLQNMAHPAPLYFDQVKQLLQQNDVSDDFELHYDSSQKLIVQFHGTPMRTREMGNQMMREHIPGNILMPVYRAIKLRQLNIPLTIRVYPPSVAKEKLHSHILHSTSSMISMREQSSEYKPIIPWDQQFVEISVSHVEDAGNFYGHLQPSTTGKLYRVYKLLNSYNLLCELSAEVEDGAIYAAPFTDHDEDKQSYYRAKVTKKHLGEKNAVFVDVFFVDYGNSAKYVPSYDLREVFNDDAQKELDDIPHLAVKFALAEVAPSVWNSMSGHWSKEANVFVRGKLMPPGGRNTWTAQIYSYVNGVAAVHLYLEDEGREGNPPCTLNDVLVQKGYAKKKEENYLSKRNHAKREEVITRGEHVMDSIDESKVFRSMNKDLFALPFTQGSSTKHLKGPHSPLEMKLYSKIKSSCQKEVKVEWNSVNSVLLDTEPNEPYEKLLVAGYVSQSSDGRKLLLNHTTVLPNLHGLAALVCLLFAPTVEFRSDDCRSRYTGALCGLGSDPSSGEPYFPENDMEIKFDMDITNDDLVLINKVRYFMNLRFCGLDSEDMPEHQVFTYQKNIKELLLKLLSKKRQPVKVEHFRCPFRWNLVNENHLLAPFEGTVDESLLTSVYHLFSAIELNPKNDFNYIQDLVKKVKNLMSCIEMDMAPKELVCHLCDVDFPYWVQVREHVESGHHKELLRWLQSRAAAHGLSLDLPKRSVNSTIPPARPSTNRQQRQQQQQTIRPTPSTSRS